MTSKQPSAGHGKGSVGRGIVLGALAGSGAAAGTVVLGAVLAVSAGLLMAAIAIGWIVAVALRAGAVDHLASGRRRAIAAGIAVGAVGLAQVGLWLFARAEGGVLPFDAHLAQTYGILVPAQFGLAALSAWWSAR